MLFLDCEFNGHGGRLISMALVSDKGDEFYEVIFMKFLEENPIVINQWVKENVLPVLNKESITEEEFSKKLITFLKKHVGEKIIADSPADFIYLLSNLHGLDEKGGYWYLNMWIEMSYINSGELKPEIPHNALSDAKALMNWYLQRYGTN